MADIALANSTYSTGTNDTASTLVNNVTATDAQQWNGVATGVVGIETILGTGTSLKGTQADLVTRLAVLLQQSGNIADKDAGTTYTKNDGWLGYGTSTLRKLANMRFPGEITMSSLTAIPTGWLELNAQQVSCTTYVDLFDACLPELDAQAVPIAYSRGTAAFTMAQATDINTGTDTFTHTAHGLSNNTVVHFKSSVTIPTGMATLTKYYIVGAAANTFQISLTQGGAAVDITAVGSGTLSLYNTFQLPDYRSRSPIGAGTGSGLSARTLNVAYGEETHLLTASESGLPAHAHTVYNIPQGAGKFIGNGSGYNNPTSASTATAGPSSAASAHNTIHPVFGIKYLVRT